jgi:hypothetical protein
MKDVSDLSMNIIPQGWNLKYLKKCSFLLLDEKNYMIE